MHDIEECSADAQVLGWHIEGELGRVRPTRRRIWRARLAARHAASLRRVSTRAIERLLGHLPFVSLIRREALSILSRVYRFVRGPPRVAVMPPGVMRELLLWDAMDPLLFQNLRAAWHPVVGMTDASHWGFGALEARLPLDLVGKVGRQKDKWRFSRAGDPSARSGAGFVKGGETGRSRELLRSTLTPGHVRAPLIMPAPYPC